MRRNTFIIIILSLVGLAGLAAVGYGVFQIGYEQGLVETGAEVVRTVGPAGFPGWGGGGFWVVGIFFRVLFLILILTLISRVAFGWRRWGGPPWARGMSDDHPMHRRLEDWHSKAHESGSGPAPTA